MSNTPRTKRPRVEPKTTAVGSSSSTAAALTVPAEDPYMLENPDGARPVTRLMRQRSACRTAKQLIMVQRIKYICNGVHQNPGEKLDTIADLLNDRTDSEDEPTGHRIMLPAEDVVSCDQM